MRKSALLLTLIVSTSLTGCAVGPDYKRPGFDLARMWPWEKSAAPKSSADEIQGTVDWWNTFNDPVLTNLIGEGLNRNADLLLAAARVSEARALLRLQDAQLFPAIDAQGSAARTSNSANRNFGGSGFSSSSKPFNDFAVAAVLNWEIDLWGRLRRASESARAQLLSIRANRDAVRLAVASDIASSYFNLRALDARIGVTKETIKARGDAYNYQKKQYDFGQIDQLTYRQTEAELAAAEAQLPLLEQAQYEQQNALSVLLGRSIREISDLGIERGPDIYKLQPPKVIAKETPAVILTRRPDVQAAEQQLISANADIGVARSAYFPTLSISSLLGLNSAEQQNLLQGSARQWQLGANAAMPLIDFGRTGANVDAAKARAKQEFINYEQTARLAYTDVLNAMNAQGTADSRIKAQNRQVRSRNDTLRVANIRYDEGYSSFLEVLDAQRFLYQAQLEQIDAKLDRLNASVNLYKSLGGGWPLPGTTGQPLPPKTSSN